jgi:hypothetical protein
LATLRILYARATGNLFCDADGNGAGAAVLFATLQAAPAITASELSSFEPPIASLRSNDRSP